MNEVPDAWSSRGAFDCRRSSTWPSTWTSTGSSLDRVLQGHRLAAARDLDFERGRLAQLGVDLERLVGRGQLEAVDRLQRIAVGQPELGKRRARPDRVHIAT